MMKIIGVGAGKGGVGKSTLTCQLALSLTNQGYRVGILDADVYGPSLDLLMPYETPPSVDGDHLIPATAGGIQLMSVAYFRSEAAIVRAPIANQTVERFLTGTKWDSLDFLLVDFPPGTGDVQLTLLQRAPFEGAVLVTTPQDVALLDVEKAHTCFEALRVPTLGVIENMAYFDHGGERLFPMGEGGGERLSRSLGAPLLGRMPLDPRLSCEMPLLDATAPIVGQLLAQLEGDPGLDAFEVIWQPDFTPLDIEIRPSRQRRIARIQKIFQSGPRELAIEWTDGGQNRYDLSEIEKHCPCAACSGKKKTRNPETSIERVVSVGRYGMKFEFNKGCRSGIYSYALLRGLHND